ncbi:MAG: hypothetical protein L0Y74_01800, partial [candidate division Zixibacteria bacterium]|nr:hypothetical protein [candidate division Zixibacteria bacterium]
DLTKGSRKIILPLAAVAVVLPVLMAGVLPPEGFKFFSKASSDETLRLWMEPSEVVLMPGQKYTYRIMAEFDSFSPLSRIAFEVKGDLGVVINPSRISFSEAFKGRKQVGMIEGSAVSAGEKKIWIDTASVDTGLPNLDVITGEAKILVR